MVGPVNRVDISTYYVIRRGDGGRSLGFQGQNFALSPNLSSVRLGRVGLGSYPDRTVNRVWACNSGLRVATGFLASDSKSTGNFGSYRILPRTVRYFYAEL